MRICAFGSVFEASNVPTKARESVEGVVHLLKKQRVCNAACVASIFAFERIPMLV